MSNAPNYDTGTTRSRYVKMDATNYDMEMRR